MASQKSNELQDCGVPERGVREAEITAPKRERGRLRVEAILSAAADVFAARGYDAATMTEIALRAETAIGSLYRFFPTKALVAQMLVERYSQQVEAELLQVGETLGLIGLEAPRASDEVDVALLAERLAQALMAIMSKLEAGRATALALVDAQGEAGSRLRMGVRESMLSHLETLLRGVTGASDERGRVSAKVVLLLLKGVPTFSDSPPVVRQALHEELTALIAVQIART